MDIERCTVPGRGVLSICTTRDGHRLGVMRSSSGEFELELFLGGGDEPGEVLSLAPDEADSLATLLFSPPLLDRLAIIERKLTALMDRR